MAGLSDITVAISTNISNFQRGLDRAQKKLQKAGRGFQEAGQTMSTSLTLPLAAAGAGAVKVASDYEDAVAEIRKVSDQETASKLADQIKQMATEIPLAQSEIANLAADAARFGVEGTKSIQQFTKTVAQMSFTTDLSANEAGRSLAKIAEQTDTPISEIDRLGSTIVKLGDNMATSQQEIVKAMSRGAIAARNFGLSGQEIAGLSARINEVSESSERAGTRLRRVFQELQEPKKVQKVAEALGMSAKEFNALKENSPQKALQAVVQEISKGGEAGKQMANIFATSSRAALQGLAADTSKLADALGMAEKEFNANNELSRQAAIQQQKFSNQLQLALNKLRNVGITIGNKLMPHVLSLVNLIQRGISAFSSLSSGMQDIVIVGAGIAAALGPVIFLFGFFVSSVLPGLISALSVVSGAFATLLSPVGLISAALAGAAALIIENWSEVKQFFTALGVMDALKKLLSVTKSVVQGVIGAASILFDAVSQSLNGTGNAFAKVGEITKKALSFMFNNIKSVFNAVIDVGMVFITGIKDVAGVLNDVLSEDYAGAFYSLNEVARTVFLGILKIVTKTVDGILATLQKLIGFIPKVGDKLANGIQNMRDGLDTGTDAIKDKLGLKKTEQEAKDAKEAVEGFGNAARIQGKIITNSLSFPSLGGGGSGGEDEQQKPSLPQLVKNFSNQMRRQGSQNGQGGEGGGEGGALSLKTLNRSINMYQRLNQQMRRQGEQQRKNALLNQRMGQMIGRSTERISKSVGKSFTAVVTGQKKAGKAFSNFGKKVGSIFQNLVTQLIQMVIKMLAIKAITAAITGGGSLLGGIGGGSFGGSLIKGIGGIGSSLIGGSGSNSGNDQGGGFVFGSARGDELSIVERRRNRQNGKIGTDRGPD